MTKRRHEGEQTKQHIIDQAKILFSQKGYTGTSIKDICDATGCSKGSIYYHFKNKEDIFLNLAEQTFTQWWEQWEKISSQYELVANKLYAYADYKADNFQKPMNKAGEEFLSKVGANSEAGKTFLAIINNFLAGYEKLMSEGIARGEFKNDDPKELAGIFVSLHTGLSHSCYVLNMNCDVMKAFFRKGTDVFLQGISTSKNT
ncbi:TetR/AcrR family transcriptional regulator [Desulfoscipio gibsoniae]|uniref:Transcriptional regulator n=1 Tax=Desulfoscipio gibsoniae DSM 7213 TaxID=767817 RepID=R4KF46_9FIRM|nr:TetR/AcrR family transcriptional regulator [Desulfoscipio gibsoniae]AGL01214.1 transcriptional regulator [Desulfoscipio gibsoniae DSM 7213]